MELHKIRERFREHCGSPAFERLVRAFHRHVQMAAEPTVFQDALWDEFARVAREVPYTGEQLAAILNVCPLHQRDLEPGRVPVAYGLISFEPGYCEAMEVNFPFAKEFVLGGCCIDGDSNFEEDVFFCSECRQALASWEAEHGRGS